MNWPSMKMMYDYVICTVKEYEVKAQMNNECLILFNFQNSLVMTVLPRCSTVPL